MVQFTIEGTTAIDWLFLVLLIVFIIATISQPVKHAFFLAVALALFIGGMVYQALVFQVVNPVTLAVGILFIWLGFSFLFGGLYNLMVPAAVTDKLPVLRSRIDETLQTQFSTRGNGFPSTF